MSGLKPICAAEREAGFTVGGAGGGDLACQGRQGILADTTFQIEVAGCLLEMVAVVMSTVGGLGGWRTSQEVGEGQEVTQ